MTFIHTDEAIRAGLGVVPRSGGRELRFGFGGDSGEPAAVTLGEGRTVRFHGVIDRVDVGVGGSPVVVFDYKTGGVDDPARGPGARQQASASRLRPRARRER